VETAADRASRTGFRNSSLGVLSALGADIPVNPEHRVVRPYEHHLLHDPLGARDQRRSASYAQSVLTVVGNKCEITQANLQTRVAIIAKPHGDEVQQQFMNIERPESKRDFILCNWVAHPYASVLCERRVG
jgi:hypothetical protein